MSLLHSLLAKGVHLISRFLIFCHGSTRHSNVSAYSTANTDPSHCSWRRRRKILLGRGAYLLESDETIREPRKINNNMIRYLGPRICVVWKKEMYRFYAIRFICF